MAMNNKTTLPLLLILGTWIALISGCTAESGILRAPGGPAVAMRVFVRDSASLVPIEGAAISAESTSRDHPFSAASVLKQTGPESSRATTDAHGSAMVSVLAEREYRIVVWAPGRAPVVFGPSQLMAGPGVWMDADLPPGGAVEDLQLRIGGESTSAAK